MKIKDILIVILVLLVFGLGGYLVYDKVLNDDCIVVDNNDNNTTNVDEEIVDYDEIDMEKYKNYDGSYGKVKYLKYSSPSYLTEYSYNLTLSLDGKVVAYDNNSGAKNEIKNVSDVIDIISFSSDAGGLEVANCYMLTKSGDVYKYSIIDLTEKKYEATKVENVSGVEKIMEVSWSAQENAGGSFALVAITKEGKIIEISRGSV